MPVNNRRAAVKSTAVLMLIGLFMVILPSASAEVISMKEIGISLLVPDGWDSQRANGLLSAHSADGEISMFVWSEQAENVQSSFEQVYEGLKEFVQGFETMMRGEELRQGYSGEPTMADTYYLAGLGVVGEQVMDCSLALVDVGEAVAVVLVYFDGYDDKVDKHYEITEPILTGVKRIR